MFGGAEQTAREVVHSSTARAPEDLSPEGRDHTKTGIHFHLVRQGKTEILARTAIILIGMGFDSVRFCSRRGGDFTCPIRMIEDEERLQMRNHRAGGSRKF